MALRLRLFKRIPYLWATVFATALVVVQLLEHTNPVFACCCFVYILIATTAFNIADGLTTLPGNFVFGSAVLMCLLGVTTKALIGEPGESNLKSGVATIEIYVLSMVAMLAAVIVEKNFRAKRPFIATALKIQDMDAAYIGCAIVGVSADIYYLFNPIGQSGSISALFVQLNRFTPFAIILGTIQVVRKSHGRSNLSASLLFLLLFETALGFLSFSKEGMFLPAVAWLIGMFAAEYRPKISDLALFAVLLFVMVRFAVPFSQFGRAYRPENGGAIKALPDVLYLLQNFDFVDNGYAEGKMAASEDDIAWHYYGKDLGQMERLTMLPPDDALIDFTDRGHLFGFSTTVESFENLIPHFIWLDKPRPHAGNIYWHELGMGEGDDSTGISFSPTADAYHQGGLAGVLLLEPVLLCGAFLLWSYLLGGTRQHPATLVLALLISHTAPEGGVNGIIMQPYILAGIFFVAGACRYVFPVLGASLKRRLPQARRRFFGSKRPFASANGPVTDNRQARSLG